MVRSTRASYACARCYKRKKKCDRGYPSCTQCIKAKAQCIGLDRGSEAELPRSLVSYLEDLVAQLESDRHAYSTGQRSSISASVDQASHDGMTYAGTVASLQESTNGYPDDIPSAYSLAVTAAKGCPPAACFIHPPRYVLPYHRAFFLSAELPYPLAFQGQRPFKIPMSHGGSNFTPLPDEVVHKLMSVYIERTLPQYPLFLRHELIDMFQRFKLSQLTPGSVTPDEAFMVSMILAISTLSSRTKDYRKLVSLAEALRRDAYSHLEFGLNIHSVSITTVRQLLLIAQYGFLYPSSTNLWQVVGDATRTALELGLHQHTPLESGLDDTVAESRKRMYWTLYAIERTVAITSHRPFGVAGDQVNVPFPLHHDDPNFPDGTQIQLEDTTSPYNQVPYIRFIDRLRLLRIQAEICSINIGMRSIPNSYVTYEEWRLDVEQRVADTVAQSATPKWASFMASHSILLLHMPCSRNPNPDDVSVLKFFEEAVRSTYSYWELTESGCLYYPWHGTHHCYEAGNLILFGLWYHRDLIRQHYTTSQVFEVVHKISSSFILLEKQWPAAQQCGALFDRLKNGALAFFREDGPADSEPSLEARQLKELVFRENADYLYAREQPTVDKLPPLPLEPMFPAVDIDQLSLDNNTDFLGFLNFSDDTNFDSGFFPFPSAPGDGGMLDQSDLMTAPLATQSPASTSESRQGRKTSIDEGQLRIAMEKLPICSHCKRKRIKCDMNLPACRHCSKLNQDCSYWDTALCEETSRRHIHTLHQQVEKLIGQQRIFSTESDIMDITAQPPTQPMPPTLTRQESRHLPKNKLSNILCPIPSEAAKDMDVFYYGATSTFARLATKVGKSIPLPKEPPSNDRPPMILEMMCSSIRLEATTDISQVEAQNLAWHYYRCIEITYPVLGHDLISQTLEDIYSGSTVTGNPDTVRTRFNLMLAISLAVLSAKDQRLRLMADTYFRKALTCGTANDLFLHPGNQSLQILVLMCIYAWLCPSAIDVWRLMGHACRMSLDIIEIQGSSKTDSEYSGLLYRTLYTLETHISVATGRPHQLPDGKEAPVNSPESNSLAAKEPAKIIYNLARLQNRFHRDTIGTDRWYSGKGQSESHADNAPWMTACIQEIRSWLDEWNNGVDSLLLASSSPYGSELTIPLKQFGEFQQCEALLLAKLTADRRNQPLISAEEEVAVCKQLLNAASGLYLNTSLAAGFVASQGVSFISPLTWTRTHAIFTATIVLLQHAYASVITDMETRRLMIVGLDILMSLDRTADMSAPGLANCIKALYKPSDIVTTI